MLSKILKTSVLLTLTSCMLNAAEVDKKIYSEIDTRVHKIEDKLISWRRDIHQHPELSGQEYRTAKLVADHLRKLGIEVQEGVGGTGVVGLLKGGKPGKTVALRADMDALPIKELVDLPFASKAKGIHMGKEVDVMHACGHDGHTAILMATAEVLAGMKDDIKGSVKFIFQPAEEGLSQELEHEDDHIGALAMIDDGALDGVDAIFGLHLIPAFPVGTVGYRSGPILASGDKFSMKVTGKQTHGAFPWNGVDSILTTSQIIQGFQNIVSRQTNITKEPIVISVGSIHGGNRENIVPENVDVLGTVRTFDEKMRAETHERMKKTAQYIAEASGAKAEIKFHKPAYSATINDPELSAQMLPSMQKATDGKAVISPKLTASEDFSEFSKRIPGVFFFLGSKDPNMKGRAAPNHSPKFTIDEDSLAVGVKVMSTMAVDYLSQN